MKSSNIIYKQRELLALLAQTRQMTIQLRWHPLKPLVIHRPASLLLPTKYIWSYGIHAQAIWKPIQISVARFPYTKIVLTPSSIHDIPTTSWSSIFMYSHSSGHKAIWLTWKSTRRIESSKIRYAGILVKSFKFLHYFLPFNYGNNNIQVLTEV